MDSTTHNITIMPTLATRSELAQLLRVNRSYLDHAACRGDGPPFYRVGRAIRYDVAAVAAWLAGQPSAAA